MIFIGFDDILNRLFDANIHDFIAIVGENDINEIFANIMDIAFNCGNQEYTFIRAFHFLHELL